MLGFAALARLPLAYVRTEQRLVIEAGAFSFTGQAVGSLADRTAAYILIGQSATLTWTRNPTRHLAGLSEVTHDAAEVGTVTATLTRNTSVLTARTAQTNITTTLTRNSTIIN